MMRALWTAGSGMKAQQLNIDIISHNLSNVNTNGFKKNRAEFQDLIYETIREAGIQQGNTLTPVGLQVGHGVRPAATQRIFTPGSLHETGNPLDIAIEGKGFFMVDMPDESTAYTRDGSFKLDSEGYLVTTDGYRISGDISVSPDAADIAVSADGIVSYLEDGNWETSGEITLAAFANPAGLEAQGRNLYRETEAVGEVTTAIIPGEDSTGVLASGYLELSNVQAVEEMINMIVAQRAYELNSKAIQTSDEMLGMANNLKR